MIKILAVCGNGLGSSLMLKINVAAAVKDLGVADIEVGHCDLTSVASEKPDVVVVTKDLASNFGTSQHVISLANVMSKAELKEKLQTYFAQNRN
jgi:PTS system ascorbate-specific IIB component